jgi:hypothetical protein
MSRAVVYESFGGPEVLNLAEQFGVTLPSGFGYDLRLEKTARKNAVVAFARQKRLLG